MAKKSWIDKAKDWASVTTTSKNNAYKNKIMPTYTNDKGQVVPVEYTPEIEKLYDYYLSQCTTNQKDIQDRKSRNKLLKEMYRDSDIITLAVGIMVNECIKVQDSGTFISVKTKNTKLSKKINELLNKWEINENTARSQFTNLAIYGNAYKYRRLDKNGIDGFDYLDVNDVKRRLEFSPLKINDWKEQRGQLTMLANNFTSMANLIKAYDETEGKTNLNNMLESVLMGFELEMGLMLAPWQISHARLYSTDSEFWPYGRSMFVNSISAYLQLKAALNLMVMARVENNPTEIWSLVAEGGTETEKWAALNRFVQNLKTLNATQNQAEQKGIKSSIFIIDGLFNYKIESPNIDVGQIADIEMLEMRLIRPTGIPLNLVKAEGSQFNSGKLLKEQSKIISRNVYGLQTAYLENLVEDIKLHLAITDDPMKDEDFELIMQSPVVEETDDVMSSKTSSLDMVNSILSSVKDAIGIDMNVDIDKNLVIDLFSKYSFLDVQDVKKIVNVLYAGKEDAKEELGDEDYFKVNNDLDLETKDNNPYNGGGNNFTPKEDTEETKPEEKVEEGKRTLGRRLNESEYVKIQKGISEELLKEAYFKAKSDLRMNEGIINGKHYMTSNYTTKSTQQLLKLIKEYVKLDANVKKKLK